MTLRTRWLTARFTPTACWLRLGPGGPGVVFLHRSVEPLFSERHGHHRFWPAYPARWRARLLERAY